MYTPSKIQLVIFLSVTMQKLNKKIFLSYQAFFIQ